jgi:integrase
MAIRVKNGKLEYRFMLDGVAYSKVTDLVDTKQSRTKCQEMELEAKKKVKEGREGELKIQSIPFSKGADSFNEWCRGRYKIGSSAKKRKSSMSVLCAYFKDKPISMVSVGQVEDFMTWRRNVHKVQEVTLQGDMITLSMYFDFAIRHNWCIVNRTKGIKKPSSKDAVRMNVLSEAQEQEWFRILKSEWDSAKIDGKAIALAIQDLSILMLNQGCRPEEILAMRSEHVDIINGYMQIIRGKTKSAKRKLKLTKTSMEVLSGRLKNEYLFPNYRKPSIPLTINPVSRQVNRIMNRSNIEKRFVLYDLRHTFATRAVERGVPIAKVAKVLGHSGLRSVMKYVHMEQEHMDSAMQQFDTGFRPNLGQIEPTIRHQ